MSTISVEIKKPFKVEHHFNADRLDILTFDAEGGFSCVVGRGEFTTDDLVLYIPPDAVLTDNIMESLSQNKITMKSNRLCAINIRGFYSEGLCLKPADWLPSEMIFEGNEVGEYLGIKKYIPKPNPRDRGLAIFKAKGTNIHYQNENFRRYTDIERFEKHTAIFRNTKEVVITTKFHGSNFRAGVVKVPEKNLSWWQKFKRFFTGKDYYEFLVGSHKAIRKPSRKQKISYKEDLYWRAAIQYDLQNVAEGWSKVNAIIEGTQKDIIFFGEILNVQRGYNYGIRQGEIALRIFDIYADGRWLPWDDVKQICSMYNLPVVDELYRGPWNVKLKDLAEAVDEYNGQKYNREGVVVKDAEEKSDDPYKRRTIAKVINKKYAADKKNTEFH